MTWAALDQETMPALHCFGFEEQVAIFIAEGRYVDNRQRIGRFQPKPCARRHAGEAFARLEYRQRAVQAPKIIDIRGHENEIAPRAMAINRQTD